MLTEREKDAVGYVMRGCATTLVMMSFLVGALVSLAAWDLMWLLLIPGAVLTVILIPLAIWRLTQEIILRRPGY